MIKSIYGFLLNKNSFKIYLTDRRCSHERQLYECDSISERNEISSVASSARVKKKSDINVMRHKWCYINDQFLIIQFTAEHRWFCESFWLCPHSPQHMLMGALQFFMWQIWGWKQRVQMCHFVIFNGARADWGDRSSVALHILVEWNSGHILALW